MKRKKHKHTRRAMRFYRIHYGFRPPFKVLLDGNFVHAVEAMKRGTCADLLPKLLGGPVRLFTTKCVMHELRGLGKEYAGTHKLLKCYALHKCGHDDGHVSAAECLAAQVLSPGSQQQRQQENGHGARAGEGAGDAGQEGTEGSEEESEEEWADADEGQRQEREDAGDPAGCAAGPAASKPPARSNGSREGSAGIKTINREHFFVATQDRSLQRRLMAAPGGAVLFVSVNGLHLDPPSRQQQSAATATEQRHQLPSAAERASGPLREVEEERRQRQQALQGAAAFRRKKAKGPNPLSMQPKKRKQQSEAGGGGQRLQQDCEAAGGEQQQRTRKRRRGKVPGREGAQD